MAVQSKQSIGCGYTRPVYLVAGARSPFLRAKGGPGPFSAADLAVSVGREVLLRQNFSADQLDEVILGCVIPAPDEANIARVVSLRLGCGERVPAWTVQRNCASGMQALASAAERIAAGYSDLILAGGTEAMSRAPILWGPELVALLADWQRARSYHQKLLLFSRLRLRHLQPIISLLQGLTDPITGLIMGQTAENLATRFRIGRQAMDAFAVQSHERLAAAIDADRFDEIIPLFGPDGSLFTVDDGLRRDADLEKLSRLKPYFDRQYGRVTAGNSSQISDGAVLLLLASESAVEQYDLPVLGQLHATAWAGLDPAEMGLGPVYAMDALLQRCPDAAEQIELWEINEAFAAQVLACLAALEDSDWQRQELGHETLIPNIDPARLNIAGGAVALGHPIGASGARIVLQLLQDLRKAGGGMGIASLCIGGGQGGAMLIEAKGGAA